MSATHLRAGAAALPIATETGHDPAAGLPPGQEAELRALAVVLEGDRRLAIVVSDTLIIPADVLEAAAAEIVARTGIPFENLLLCATHTHHAPGTIDILGATRDREFCARLQEALIGATEAACRKLDAPGADAELHFALSQEASFAENSRYLLRDGTIAWYNYPWAEVVRPTGPCDPDLPVLALRRPGGEMTALIFSHATHNIGTLAKGARSPGLFGLAAQELERRQGGTALFLPGAFGSTHHTSEFGSTENTRAIPTAECVRRVVTAVEEGLGFAEAIPVPPMVVLKRPFAWRVRSFDDEAEAAAVRYWSETYAPGSPESVQAVFREMRAQMAPVQGEERQAWLQVIRLGEIALVGVPAELFARLGLALRRRSPFRHTFVIGLANGTLGYVGDRAAYDLGGYQLWAGWHSASEPGTGEAMVEQALAMLHEAHATGGQR